ncbi:hypothetical protein O7598_31290 [Micromonospora sp. WMMC241]|nr:hypothetical protein [Micromonospora sp. WMMC241]MCZ7434779.1 hypothetical protein [Micromonospora sp. WMMC241]MCZ7440834.1 hypothetical protein [Micromonospora sp. WMMC241]MCZ7440911.1 hypothetical protein [Micromonospora sp. WMMC241]
MIPSCAVEAHARWQSTPLLRRARILALARRRRARLTARLWRN